MKRLHFWLIFVLFLVIASSLRIATVFVRPIHHDEISAQMLATTLRTYGMLRYEPEFHGPVIFFIVAGAQVVFGETERNIRIIHVTFSILTLLIIPLLIQGDRKRLALLFLLAFSPTLVYYSGYAYFESWWVLLYGLWLVSAMRILFQKDHHPVWLYIFVAASILMHATHEFAYVIFYVFGIFIVVRYLMQWWRERRGHARHDWGYPALEKHVVFLFVFGLLLFAFVWSSGFADVQGISENIVKSVNYNLHKGLTPSGHDKPFYYYARLLVTLESLLVAALLFGMFVLRSQEDVFLLLLTLASVIVLSVVKYKTPWGLVLILPPLLLFCANVIVNGWTVWNGTRTATVVCLLLLLVPIAQSVRIGLVYPNMDAKNPLSYVQTTTDLWAVEKTVHQMRPSSMLLIGKEKQILNWVFKRYAPVLEGPRNLTTADVLKYRVIFADPPASPLASQYGLGSYEFTIRPGLNQVMYYQGGDAK